MGKTKIEWTATDGTPGYSFNPWIGCSKVSEGCTKCYAEVLNRRWGNDNWGPGKPRRLTSEENWKLPIKWDRDVKAAGRRARVFCASMADVFDAEAPPGALDALWSVIRATPNLDWLLLTKRPERIAESLPEDWPAADYPNHNGGWPNVWLGTSVETQKYADVRIPILCRVPARVRFLSVEPMLGPVDFRLKAASFLGRTFATSGNPGISWVICGGESGHGARPMDLAWARDLRDQCRSLGVAYFFKQVGSVTAQALGHRGKGESSESIPEDLRIREFPEGNP